MRRFGLIGYPLGHSFSGKFFAEKFAREHIHDAVYELFPIESIDAFHDLWNTHQDLVGLNVTIPYKAAVIPLLDILSPAVQEIGACNCVMRKNGKLCGYNTDVAGFEATLLEHQGAQHHKALVLGTGGASKAVDFVLRKHGIAYRHVRREATAEALSYAQLTEELVRSHTLIINTTPLGMYPNVDEYPNIPYASLGQEHLLIDLVYNPSRTRFMEKGAQMGASVCNGEQMLVVQAEESWSIWNQP
jgi:shikimate dehydrogenase